MANEKHIVFAYRKIQKKKKIKIKIKIKKGKLGTNIYLIFIEFFIHFRHINKYRKKQVFYDIVFHRQFFLF